MPKMKKFTTALLVFLVVLAIPLWGAEKSGTFIDMLAFSNEAWAMAETEHAESIYVNQKFILTTGQKVLAKKLADEQKQKEAKAEAKAQAEAKAKVAAGAAKKEAKAATKAAMAIPHTDDKGTYLGEFVITAYCSCAICCGEGGGKYTASGTVPKVSQTVAVDTRIIPMGSTIYIEGVGTRIAEDRGGLIKGKKLDIYMKGHETALKWGRQTRKVWLQK